MLKILQIIPSCTSQKVYSFVLFLFLHHYLLFPCISSFCINVLGTYLHLEKQELDMYWLCCRYIVQILVFWSMKTTLAFS